MVFASRREGPFGDKVANIDINPSLSARSIAELGHNWKLGVRRGKCTSKGVPRSLVYMEDLN
jgi:hypothetical protein